MWTSISSDNPKISTFAYQVDKIGCIVLVKTDHSDSVVFVPGTEINDNKLRAMKGYGEYIDTDV
jgi:hypothetical protein